MRLLKGLKNYLPLHTHVPAGSLLLLRMIPSHEAVPAGGAFSLDLPGSCSNKSHAVGVVSDTLSFMNARGFKDPMRVVPSIVVSHVFVGSSPPDAVSALVTLLRCFLQSPVVFFEVFKSVFTVSPVSSGHLTWIPSPCRLGSFSIPVLASLYKTTHSKPERTGVSVGERSI